MKKILVLPLIIASCLLFSVPVFAQDEKDGQQKHDHDTYAKVGLVYWKDKLLSPGYNLDSLSIDLETYFNTNHLQLSGWSMGYRKDDLNYSDSGHLLNFKVFRTLDLKVMQVKASIGEEWGMPSLAFDKSVLEETASGGDIHYRQTYLIRNSNVPYTGTKNDGVYYPFIDVGLLKRKGPFIIDAGIRANWMEFGNDSYIIKNDIVIHDLNNKRKWVVAPFINVGIKIGR